MKKTEESPIDVVRVKELMRANGISSLAELASRAGINRSTVSRLLGGDKRRSGSADTLAALASVLNTTVDYLRGETNDPRRSESEPLPPYAIEVLAAMRQLGATQNYELHLIAKTFVDNQEKMRDVRIEEISEWLLDIGDKLGDPKETDQITKLLQELHKRSKGNVNEIDDDKNDDSDGIDGDIDDNDIDDDEDNLPPLLPVN